MTRKTFAGGRKTMGIYLTAAMQLFGRTGDELSHFLVNEDFEGNPKFFYPPPVAQIIETLDKRLVSTAAAQTYLARVPFIRLRGINESNEEFTAARRYEPCSLLRRKQLDAAPST